jgi:hypothetical protein
MMIAIHQALNGFNPSFFIIHTSCLRPIDEAGGAVIEVEQQQC